MIRYVEVAPAADLRPWVDCFWSLTGQAGERLAGNRVLPDGCMDVILRFGDCPANRDASSTLETFVVGAMTSSSVVWQAGRVDTMGVRFRPGGGPVFFGLPASELTDRLVSLHEFWPDAAELFERACGVGTQFQTETDRGVRDTALGTREQLRARSEILQELLRRRNRERPEPVVASAIELIEAHGGRMRIDQIGDSLGISPRSLERRFLTQTGLSPKLASRIVRFQAAASVLQKDPRAPLATLAVERGYHDQAHMTREFRELAGLTPAAYASERAVGFVQDGISAIL